MARLQPSPLPIAQLYSILSTVLSPWRIQENDVEFPKDAELIVTWLYGRMQQGHFEPGWPDLARILVAERAMAEEYASALMVRVFIDALNHPDFEAPFRRLPVSGQERWATTWATTAGSAWRAGWYPEIESPVLAAGMLSNGRQPFFMPIAQQLDAYRPRSPFGQVLPVVRRFLRRVPEFPKPKGRRLPTRVGAGVPVLPPPQPVTVEGYLSALLVLNVSTGLPPATSMAVLESVSHIMTVTRGGHGPEQGGLTFSPIQPFPVTPHVASLPAEPAVPEGSPVAPSLNHPPVRAPSTDSSTPSVPTVAHHRIKVPGASSL